MLIKFTGQTIADFYVPGFTLAKTEIVIIEIIGGYLFRPATFEIAKILTGKAANNYVEIVSPLTFVEHFSESRLRSRFLPMRVQKYHRRYANKINPIYQKIYETKDITPKTKVCDLLGKQSKKLALYTTQSHTNNIVFDLAGVDSIGGQEIYSFVKTVVEAGGSAILIDHCDEFKNDCTTFIKAEYLGDSKGTPSPK